MEDLPIFQFHKGTIRTLFLPYYDIFVRVFQFHKGTIRTRHFNNNVDTSLKFQFHKGTIRTSFPPQRCHLPLNFNSIKVRLELLSEDYLLTSS